MKNNIIFILTIYFGMVYVSSCSSNSQNTLDRLQGKWMFSNEKVTCQEESDQTLFDNINPDKKGATIEFMKENKVTGFSPASGTMDEGSFQLIGDSLIRIGIHGKMSEAKIVSLKGDKLVLQNETKGLTGACSIIISYDKIK